VKHHGLGGKSGSRLKLQLRHEIDAYYPGQIHHHPAAKKVPSFGSGGWGVGVGGGGWGVWFWERIWRLGSPYGRMVCAHFGYMWVAVLNTEPETLNRYMWEGVLANFRYMWVAVLNTKIETLNRYIG
jgi:hypothetical protein